MPITASATRQAWIRTPQTHSNGNAARRDRVDPAAALAAQLSYFAGRPLPQKLRPAQSQQQLSVIPRPRPQVTSSPVEAWAGIHHEVTMVRPRKGKGVGGGGGRRHVSEGHHGGRGRRDVGVQSDSEDDVVVVEEEEESVRSASPARPRAAGGKTGGREREYERRREWEYEHDTRPVAAKGREYRNVDRAVSSRWDEERSWRARQGTRGTGYGGGRAGGGGRSNVWASATEPLML